MVDLTQHLQLILSLLTISCLARPGTNGHYTNVSTEFQRSYGPYRGYCPGEEPPWGNSSVYDTNPADAPNTGVTRYYNFTVARGTISPDGLSRPGLMVNGMYPGPLIEANWGDWISVTVSNDIQGPEEGTAVHWHGINQRGTPWADGVPAVSQCPIAPGASFTYTFRADTYGTSWWHAHYTAQYADGLAGPLIIYGPNHVDYDIDLGPVMLGDYSHRTYEEVVAGVVSDTTNSTLYSPGADNNLINGRMPLSCSNPNISCSASDLVSMTQFTFESGKRSRLRLINIGAADVQRFSIDNHVLTVMANDFTPLIPYDTDVVTLGVGQRSDVVVEAIGTAGSSYWMRSTAAKNCTASHQPYGKAVVRYEGSPVDVAPNSTAYFLPELNCGNDALNLTTPAFSMTPPTVPDQTITFELNFTRNATGHNVFVFNNQTYFADYDVPILSLANEGNDSYPYSPTWNTYSLSTSHSTRIVINNLFTAMHPIHLHGHSMYILHEGQGPWDGLSITNSSNPNRRDVQQLRRLGHIVIQIDADNPGVWPLHCHIAWHASMGMTVNLIERTDLLGGLEGVEGVVGKTCGPWRAWQNQGNVVDQIDAGV